MANFQGGKCTFAPIYLKISAMEGKIFWAFLMLGTMSTMVRRPILNNLFTFAYKFYNIELGVANSTGVASHGCLTIRWSIHFVYADIHGDIKFRLVNDREGKHVFSFNSIDMITSIKLFAIWI